MRLRIFTLIIAAALFTGCKKDKTNTPAATIEVTVLLQNGTALANVPVKLLSDQQRTSTNIVAKGTSNATGKIDFTVTPGKVYYLYYDGGNNESIATTLNATYIITGTFTSQAQINSSPFQSSTTIVGDPIYQDINGDGTISDQDLVLQVVGPASGKTNNATLTLFTNNVL